MTGVALLSPPGALALGLRDLGIGVVEISPRVPLVDAVLAFRKVGDGLGRVLPVVRALRAAGCPVAHAFTPTDAMAAGLWGGGAVVWTVTGAPRREELADRRLRLATYVRALEGADAVVAACDDVREGLERWLGVDAPVVPLEGAAEEYAALYERVARSRT